MVDFQDDFDPLRRRLIIDGMHDGPEPTHSPYSGPTETQAPSADVPQAPGGDTLAPSPAPDVQLPPGVEPPAPPAGAPPPVHIPAPGSAPAPPAPPAPPPPGPQQGFSRSVWDQLTQQYPGTVAGLAQLVREHPELGLQIVGGSGGDIRLPSGDIIDVLLAAGEGGRGWQWLQDTGGGGGGAAGYRQGTGDPELDSMFRSVLLQLMGNANQPLDMNAPWLRAQSDVYRNSRMRGAQNERAALAERAAFTGLNSGGQGSGAFETGIQGINEQASQDIAGHDAELMGGEVAARRQQLQHALDVANSVGARREALALQQMIAQLDNQYRYASLAQQQGQFEDSTAFNYAQLQELMNRYALLAGLNG